MLRGHVVRGAHDLTAVRQGCAFAWHRAIKARQSQIEDFHHAVCGQHEVRRFQIAVDQPALVSALQTQRCLADDLAGVRNRQGAAGMNHAAKVTPVEELHDQRQEPVGLPSVGRLNDIRVTHAAGGFRFAQEARNDRMLIGPLGG